MHNEFIANKTRDFSPPESFEIIVMLLASVMPNLAKNDLACVSENSKLKLNIISTGVLLISNSSACCCEKYEIFTFLAYETSPVIACNLPDKSLANVVFPFPLAPSSATRSSILMQRLISSKTILSPYPVDACSKMTNFLSTFCDGLGNENSTL